MFLINTYTTFKNELNQKIKYLRNIREMLFTEVNLAVNFLQNKSACKKVRKKRIHGGGAIELAITPAR